MDFPLPEGSPNIPPGIPRCFLGKYPLPGAPRAVGSATRHGSKQKVVDLNDLIKGPGDFSFRSLLKSHSITGWWLGHPSEKLESQLG